MNFLNVWSSTKDHVKYYGLGVDAKVFEIADYAIYRQFGNSYIYTYKNIAINNLAGLNKEHLKSLANGVRPTKEPDCFLYDRALNAIERAKEYQS